MNCTWTFLPLQLLCICFILLFDDGHIKALTVVYCVWVKGTQTTSEKYIYDGIWSYLLTEWCLMLTEDNIGATSLLFTVALGSCIWNWCTCCRQKALSGLNWPTSAGWRRCVVLGGSKYNIISSSSHFTLSYIVKWLLCPSIKRITGHFTLFSASKSSNTLTMYSKNACEFIHPDSVLATVMLSGTEFRISLGILTYG